MPKPFCVLSMGLIGLTALQENVKNIFFHRVRAFSAIGGVMGGRKQNDSAKIKSQARQERLRVALRDNLKRRKAGGQAAKKPPKPSAL